MQVVHKICSDAQANPERKRSRWIMRLTPISLVHKILSDGLEELAQEVLKPHFHSGAPSKKVSFSILSKQYIYFWWQNFVT